MGIWEQTELKELFSLVSAYSGLFDDTTTNRRIAASSSYRGAFKYPTQESYSRPTAECSGPFPSNLSSLRGILPSSLTPPVVSAPT